MTINPDIAAAIERLELLHYGPNVKRDVSEIIGFLSRANERITELENTQMIETARFLPLLREMRQWRWDLYKDEDDATDKAANYERHELILELCGIFEDHEQLTPIGKADERDNVGPEGGERIKDWEELRHTLAHLWNAIDHLVDGAPESAGAELTDCMANIFWNSTEEMRADLDGRTQQEEPVLGGEQAADAPEAEEVEEAKPATITPHNFQGTWQVMCPQCAVCWLIDGAPKRGEELTCENGHTHTPLVRGFDEYAADAHDPRHNDRN